MEAAVNSKPKAALSATESLVLGSKVVGNLDPRRMTLKQLQAHAQAIGVQLGRTKAEQLTLIEQKTS
jgi:hypothetical protein